MLLILIRDWASVGCLFWIVGAFLPWLALPGGASDDGPGSWIIVLFMTLLTTFCGVVILVRVWMTRRLFARGLTLKGRIVHTIDEEGESFGAVDVAYRYQGRYYRSRHISTFGPWGQNLTYDQTVEVVVDPAKPSRCLIVELYFRTGNTDLGRPRSAP